MPTKRPQTTAKRQTGPRFNDVEFVQYELSKEQKTDLKARWSTENDFSSVLCKLVEQGYKVTFKWDDYGACHSVFINPGPDNTQNANKVLTGRGRFPESALLEAGYKHAVVFDEVWPNRETPKGFDTWDD